MTQTFTGTLEVITCGGCGITFGMEETFYNLRKSDHKNWHCPNGCERHFTSKSEADKLREELNSANNLLAIRQSIISDKNQRIEQLGYSVRSLKAAKTKILNRVKNGVCPCCNRTFKDLQNHFKSKHPELL